MFSLFFVPNGYLFKQVTDMIVFRLMKMWNYIRDFRTCHVTDIWHLQVATRCTPMYSDVLHTVGHSGSDAFVVIEGLLYFISWQWHDGYWMRWPPTYILHSAFNYQPVSRSHNPGGNKGMSNGVWNMAAVEKRCLTVIAPHDLHASRWQSLHPKCYTWP